MFKNICIFIYSNFKIPFLSIASIEVIDFAQIESIVKLICEISIFVITIYKTFKTSKK